MHSIQEANVIELTYLLLTRGFVYTLNMKPRLAIVNIFDQDADRLADFAHLNGFACVDWSIDQHQSEHAFISRMERLRHFEVRFHCPFHGVDLGYADERADTSLEVLTKTMERIARAGGRHMTVHTGFGRVAHHELDFGRAVTNLRMLVRRGSECGVCISLENLSSHWTSVPELFNDLIEESGAGVTLDIGHAHVCSSRNPDSNVYERFIIPHRDRIVSAHIYHTEQSGVGHVAPCGIEDLYDRLELLQGAAFCTWWVIELTKSSDILHTRELLNHYGRASFATPPSDKEALKPPQHV